MPTPDTLDRFIERVEQGHHAEAIDEFCAANASMRENMSAPRMGRANLVTHERKVLARAHTVRSTCVRPVFVSGSKVVIRWIFEFEWKDGSVTRMEELAYQRWEGERIAEEQFFYDPAQMAPTAPAP